MELTNGSRTKEINSVTIYHQNIRSVTNKSRKLSINLHINHIQPHIICITEHHLKNSEINRFTLHGYTGA